MKNLFDVLCAVVIGAVAFEIALAIVGAGFTIPAFRRWEQKMISRFKHEEDW